MMKLSQEERTASKAGLSKFKTLLLVFLLSEIISPQIPFKGFCKLNSFNVDSGFTKIFSFNYDKDEYSDLLVFNPTKKTAKIYNGSTGIKFNTEKTISFPLEISAIEPIILPNNMIETFAFTSRKNRSFGVYKFSTTGTPSLVSRLKLFSYPENISITSIKPDGSAEFLLSGNSFDGLSIVSLINNVLVEKKLLQNRLFQNAQFIDINSDGYEDIAALNSIENKLHLFFNNSRSFYNELRYINLDHDVLSMKIFDVNYDQFKDIVVSTLSGLIIYFGDASASYSKFVEIYTSYAVDKFIIGDFNRDGFFDFNYMNIEEGVISTIFAKEFDTYYPELIQLKGKGISDLIPFFSKFVYGSAYLNQNGAVKLLSAISSMSDDQKLALGIEPNLIASFDNNNNGIIDLAFIDEFDQKIKFILRNTEGIPENIFDVSLYHNHNNILEISNSKSVKTFFLYSSDNRIIEELKIDFDKYRFVRRFHYSEGKIEDIAIKTDVNAEAELFVLYSKNNMLNLQILTKSNSDYKQKLYTDLCKNWHNPFLFFKNKLTVGYWQFENDFLKLNFMNVSEQGRDSKNKFKLDRNNQILISKSNKLNKSGYFNFAGLLAAEAEIILVSGDNEPNLYRVKNTENGFRIQDKNQLFFGKNYSIFVYNSELRTLKEIIPALNSNQLIVNDIFNDLKISNFTIQQLDQRNTHLIFTDKKSGTIEIRQLSK